ncbi:uncharacterized protein B0I36DRAFT_365771 [Microdochium trichocladiopsis]|uniref:Transcription factor domain-containing protein n=1 Tax=Microdochium trichocladiopsis TaxID=1682393 RepID=A0A9P9BK18_9PEZI|nr:uncharacterized protein B0I36DRAFT_365771 [Microdochium trichocladiopsis]KAH7026169.1 hypothetical protein B0I36DRAFT_365771 [Microdochium trichocladiopsis]
MSDTTLKMLTDGAMCSVSHGFDCTYHQRDAALARQSQRASLPRELPQHEGRPSPIATAPSIRTLDSGNISIAARPLRAASTEAKASLEDDIQPKDTSNGLSDTNRHTKGTEYYGPAGTFYFLSLLRGKASARSRQDSIGPGQDDASPRGDDGASVVNLLHSYDYCAASDAEARSGPPRLLPATASARSNAGGSSSAAVTKSSTVEVGLQKECVRLYFQSLHCIHPFLDQSTFLQRCHEEVWDIQQGETRRRRHGFLALFYVVLALGAMPAGDASSLGWTQNVEFLNQVDARGAHQASSYVPIRIARLYFDKAQSCLGNVFEISSIEIAEALFLMAGDAPTTQVLNAMVGLADILLHISHELVDYAGEPCGIEKSAKALEYDRQISVWTGNLPQRLSLTGVSLLESELITKQKIVLKLRLFSVRLLLHRPFLISAATEANHEKYAVHIRACVDVSKDTIELLYDTYASRPWFRSWWYNSTYTLDASMVLLYVVLSNMQPEPAEMLLASVEKSIEIFRAMDRVAVTRKCAEITSEVLSIARDIARGNREQALQQFHHAEQHQALGPDHAGAMNGTLGLQHHGGPAPELMFPPNLTQEDMNASLLETNLISNFLDPDGLFFY